MRLRRTNLDSGSRVRVPSLPLLEQDAIKYAKSGDVAIAYLVLGDGPPDVVFVHGFASKIEIEAEYPEYRSFYDRLAGFSRLITFDRRGSGLSDLVREAPTLVSSTVKDLVAS